METLEQLGLAFMNSFEQTSKITMLTKPIIGRVSSLCETCVNECIEENGVVIQCPNHKRGKRGQEG